VYTLIVLTKDGTEHARVPIQNGELLIGRSRGNAVVLPSTSVSRQHARVYTAQGRIFIQDLNSSNGVLIDGQRIPEAAEIQPKSQIRIGEYFLCLQVDGQPAAACAPPAPGGMGLPPQAPPPPGRFAGPTMVGGQAAPPGAPLPPRPQPAEGAVDDGTYGKLVGINGSFTGEEWILSERENTIGRTEENFILLPDPSVSRQHARIVMDEAGNYVVYDLRSSNSTAVNRKRITQSVLRNGDLVSFGNVAFRFVAPRSALDALSGLPRKRGSRGLLVVLGIFLGVLLLGGIIVGAFLLKDLTERRAKEERAKLVAAAITSAREHILAKNWTEALVKIDAGLAVDGQNPDLLKGKERAEAERKSKEALDKASTLEVEGKLDEAVAALDGVPKTSVYRKESLEKLLALNKKVDERLKEEGLAACTAKEFEDCQQKLAKYLDRNSDDADTTARLRYAEDRLRRKRIKFDRWEPPRKEGDEGGSPP
jgi:pSer/pThr/pTyr-binding forkhead associated (FHA) protein